MATRKRASSRSRRTGLVGRAVSAIREAESRLPSDVRKQLERTVKDGQKAVMSAIGELETHVRRSARQADVDKVLKRLDNLSQQVQKMAREVAARRSGAVAAPRRASTTARRTVKSATRTAPKRKPAARKPAARKPATRAAARNATKSPAAPRRAAARAASPARSRSRARAARTVPQAPAPGPVPERVDDMGSGQS
jgi:cob(I)alamin adenosyltransferase